MFEQGARLRVTAPTAPLYADADMGAQMVSELLHGEDITALSEPAAGLLHIRTQRDSYEGYVSTADLDLDNTARTHHVGVIATPLYSTPSIKGAPACRLPLNAQVAVQAQIDDRFIQLSSGLFAIRHHFADTADLRAPINVARCFLETPYVWGGRSFLGIDCSGLVQQACWATGIACPRDSGPQYQELGRALEQDETPRTGDLVFFPGHVGFYLEGGKLLHTNATHMRCTIDPLEDVIEWVARDHTEPLSGFKRLTA